MKLRLRYLATVFMGAMLINTAWGQSRSESCPSNLQVTAGSSTVIDCAIQTDYSAYQWTSKNPTWLSYLSNVTTSSPRFHAPVGTELPYYIAYHRLAFNLERTIVDKELISITVHGPTESVSSFDVQGEWSQNLEISEIVSNTPDEAPFLRCPP